MCLSTGPQPGPPNSVGHVTASQPRAFKTACQFSISCFVRARFPRTFAASSSGSSSRRKARTSPRNAFWLAGLVIALIGFSLWMVARYQLGQSFTATAQARQLVSDGLYRYFRHPIYLFGAVAHVGVFLALQQVWVLLAWAVYAAAIQWPRVRREDKVLGEAFGQEFLDLRQRNWL